MEDKVHTFPNDICPKVNVIARREYELAYYDSSVHRFNHYTTRTPPIVNEVCFKNNKQDVLCAFWMYRRMYRLCYHLTCYLGIIWPYLPNLSARAGYDTRSIFKRSFPGLNSEFSFSLTSCLTTAEKIGLPYYLPIAGGRIIGFIPFPRVLVLCEMQSVSSRIWTRVAVSISYGDNHYTTGTSLGVYNCNLSFLKT